MTNLYQSKRFIGKKNSIDLSSFIWTFFSFPVEENAAIYAFVARIDDEREIVAELKEKRAAQQEYSEALAQGHGAYLLEQDEASNDIFVISVGAYVSIQSFV
jgi:hypothetical protein